MKKLIAGNWKMNCGIAEGVVLAQEISYELDKSYEEFVDVAIIPPFLDIKPVRGVLDFDKRKNISVGAQNVYFKENGAYTGEISVSMISEAGADFCIVGHSERRNLLGETNADVNDKVKALLDYSGKVITPIICVGETLDIRDEGSYIDFVEKQVVSALAGVDLFDGKRVVVAYEPIWAIGTGRTATPEEASEVCLAIKTKLTELFGENVASDIRVLYGGSMNEGNAESLLSVPGIDGGLIGGASLKAGSFIQIIKVAYNCR